MKAIFYSILVISIFSIFLSCGGDASVTEEKKPISLIDETNRDTRLTPRFENMIKDLKADPDDHNRNGSFVNQIAAEYIENRFPEKKGRLPDTKCCSHKLCLTRSSCHFFSGQPQGVV